MRFVSPDYFRTLEIPLLEGRIFSAGDRPDRGRVVIVNETLAARHWPRGDAVGRRVIMSAGDGVYEVIGVVADVRHEGLEAEPGELMYQPWSQQPGHDLFAVVATRGDPLELAPAVRRAIRGLDPTLPLAAATTVGEMLRQTLHAPRSRAGLVGALAALALFLALIGTYAVTSFAVDRRAPEIGVRMALGASAGGVRMLVLRRTLLLALSGVVLGTLAALGGARLLRALLFGVDAADPLIFAAAATLLLAVALAAGYLPARRASRVDPARTLRAE